MPHLERDGDVFLLHLGSRGEDGVTEAVNENRFHPDWLEQVEGLLAEVAAVTGPAALVTVGAGKFYSNGLDIGYVMSDVSKLPAYLDRIHAVYARLLTLPVPTVAAVTGHAYGGGAMLALSHDVRVMRADRGYVCLPEASLKMPFTVAMAGLLRDRLLPATASEAMITSRRYGGADVVAAGWAQHAVEGVEGTVAAAVEIARAAAAGAGANLAGIRASQSAGTVEILGTRTEPFTFG